MNFLPYSRNPSSSSWVNLESLRGGIGLYYNTADLLKQILKNKIKIDPQEERTSVEIVTVFVHKLVNAMRVVDPLFDKLLQKIYYTGSYYDGLRISNANEFDINLVLKLPFPSHMLKMEYCRVKSFAKYKLQSTDWPREKRELCERVRAKFFVDEYLISSFVKEWMQSIIDKVKEQQRMPKVYRIREVSPSSSGPSKKLTLHLLDGYKIDIDLVPVIEYHGWPDGACKNIIKKCYLPHYTQFVFLVPKEYSGSEILSDVEKKRYWRMHFPEIEKKILHDRNFVKPIIKLLKLIRDKQKWSLASYYLKTVVMWMVKDHPELSYWSENNAWNRLIEALEKLKAYVDGRCIPYLFYPDYNLIENIGFAEACNISGRLTVIIQAIKISCESIQNYI